MNQKTIAQLEKIIDLLENQHLLVLKGGIAYGKSFYINELIKKFTNAKFEIVPLNYQHDYSTFVRGFTLSTEKGNLDLKMVDKILLEALKESCYGKFILVLDNIQNADISELFGIVLSEILSKQKGCVSFTLPDGELINANLDNLYIVCTWNPVYSNGYDIMHSMFSNFYIYEVESDYTYLIDDKFVDSESNDGQFSFKKCLALEEDDDICLFAKQWFWQTIYYRIDMLFRNFSSDTSNNKSLTNYTKYRLGCGSVADLSADRVKYNIIPLLRAFIDDGILSSPDGICDAEIDIILNDLCSDYAKENGMGKLTDVETFQLADNPRDRVSIKVTNAILSINTNFKLMSDNDYFTSVLNNRYIIRRSTPLNHYIGTSFDHSYFYPLIMRMDKENKRIVPLYLQNKIYWNKRNYNKVGQLDKSEVSFQEYKPIEGTTSISSAKLYYYAVIEYMLRYLYLCSMVDTSTVASVFKALNEITCLVKKSNAKIGFEFVVDLQVIIKDVKKNYNLKGIFKNEQ